MIASSQVKDIEVFAFIDVLFLIFKLLSRQVLFINRKAIRKATF